MIDIKDLQIGDWVMFPHGIDKIVDLPYIEGRGLCASFAASATLFSIPIEQIKPIPLTPEILEKNGFRHGCYVGGYYSPDCPFRVFTKTEGTCEFTTLFDDEIYFSCIFVHELQNALRLCGIDKEIKI